MDNLFRTPYRRALRELQEAVDRQYDLPDATGHLLTLAYEQATFIKTAILKNRKAGLGALRELLRGALEAEMEAWRDTQRLKNQLEHMQEAGYNSTVDSDQCRWLYYVSNDALSELLDILIDCFPSKLLAFPPVQTQRGPVPVAEAIARFGSVQGKRTLQQLIKAEAEKAPPPAPVSLPAAPAVTKRTGSPPAELSPADLILAPGFTLDEADRLARAVELTDDAGNYRLGPRKLGAVVGFVLALQQAGKLIGAIPALTAVIAPRWGVQIATRKTGTGVAAKYFELTRKALARLEKTD